MPCRYAAWRDPMIRPKGANYWLAWSKTVDRWSRFWLPMLFCVKKPPGKPWWLGVVGSQVWWVARMFWNFRVLNCKCLVNFPSSCQKQINSRHSSREQNRNLFTFCFVFLGGGMTDTNINTMDPNRQIFVLVLYMQARTMDYISQYLGIPLECCIMLFLECLTPPKKLSWKIL